VAGVRFPVSHSSRSAPLPRKLRRSAVIAGDEVMHSHWPCAKMDWPKRSSVRRCLQPPHQLGLAGEPIIKDTHVPTAHCAGGSEERGNDSEMACSLSCFIE
jgi:hypothetical protein